MSRRPSRRRRLRRRRWRCRNARLRVVNCYRAEFSGVRARASIDNIRGDPQSHRAGKKTEKTQPEEKEERKAQGQRGQRGDTAHPSGFQHAASARLREAEAAVGTQPPNGAQSATLGAPRACAPTRATPRASGTGAGCSSRSWSCGGSGASPCRLA